VQQLLFLWLACSFTSGNANVKLKGRRPLVEFFSAHGAVLRELLHVHELDSAEKAEVDVAFWAVVRSSSYFFAAAIAGSS